MGLIVDVPLNTAIADLDEALRLLLREQLNIHGFEGVEVSFDAPAKDWSGKLTGPTVDLFLYDLREATDRAEVSPRELRSNGQAAMLMPPLHLELTYAVTAWTKAVEDEHRLLSQVLTILFSYRRLPDEVLRGSGDGSAVLRAADTSVGRPREEKAEFWSAVGGQYKASIDLVVHIAVESGATFVRGPEVRTQTVRLRQFDAPARLLEELHGLGGTVHDADGRPVADAWVALPDAGRWTATDHDGRFRFGRLVAGDHRLLARSVDGAEAEVSLQIPGDAVDVVIGRARRSPGRPHASGR